MKFDLPEGATPIDADEALGLIPAIATQGELNDFEAANIVEGATWARRSRKIKSSLLDQGTLRQLHKQMLGEVWTWAGKYRTTQKNIGCAAWQITTTMKALEDDVKTWIAHGTYSQTEIAARFHHRLVWIHPFVNGNGRFARLATDLLCGQQEWPIPTWGSTNLVKQSQTRSEYIQALRMADANDFAPLQRFMYS
jgi:Fic-DOC domain mobile mystery protein B